MWEITVGNLLTQVAQRFPDAVMKAILEEHCTAVHGVPTMFIAMLEHPDFKQFDFSTLRTGIMAGSPCPVKVMQQVSRRKSSTRKRARKCLMACRGNSAHAATML